MSGNENDNTPPSPLNRRASYAPGQKLSELFGRSPTASAPSGTPAYPGPISTAAANAQANQRRRMSITTLGLSGSPSQTSPFSGLRPRMNSSSSNGSGSPPDESAIDDSGEAPNTPGSSPFGRRLSFGARAMRDVRGGMTGSFNGRASTTNTTSSPPSARSRGLSSSLEEDLEETSSPPLSKSSNVFDRRAGESSGFNWSDQMRNRVQRTSSTAGPTAQGSPNHHKSATVSSAQPPIREVPKQQPPDHFQERILKGDFYMD